MNLEDEFEEIVDEKVVRGTPDGTQFAKNSGSEGRPKPTRESLSMWHSESDSNLGFRHGLATAVSSKTGSQKLPNSAEYCQTLPTLGSKTANKATLGRKTATSDSKRPTSSSKSQTLGNNRKLWAVKCDSHQTLVELYRKDAQYVRDGPEKLQSEGNPP
jgi:hypothetical protein